MKKITINASTKYDVIIGKNLLLTVGDTLKNAGFTGKIAIITDKNVDRLYSLTVINSLKESGFSAYKYVIDGGETSKSGAEFLNILEFLAENEFTRSDGLIALGGGIVGDLTGFVASSFLRGIKFAQVPTTLLAFVDSSVGGKTAINLNAGKNLAGAFYQPSVVICDIVTAKTLSDKEYACGMAEIIKYGMLFDAQLLELLEKGMERHTEEIIARCVDWKRIVVEKDEFDNGDRQLLNFGHTLGHAIEKETDFNFLHGQAVAVGMRLITERAVKKGICDEKVLDVLDNLLEKYLLPKECEISIDKLVNRTMVDKKRKGNQITVVLPSDKGKCKLQKMYLDEWKEFVVN